MIKEIYEQPIVVAQTLRSYLQRIDETLTLPIPDFDLSAIKRVTIVACGTSFYAGMVARYWFEQFARVPVDLDVASEFRYRAPVRSEEHTSELQSLMRISYAVFCLKKKRQTNQLV